MSKNGEASARVSDRHERWSNLIEIKSAIDGSTDWAKAENPIVVAGGKPSHVATNGNLLRKLDPQISSAKLLHLCWFFIASQFGGILREKYQWDWGKPYAADTSACGVAQMTISDFGQANTLWCRMQHQSFSENHFCLCLQDNNQAPGTSFQSSEATTDTWNVKLLFWLRSCPPDGLPAVTGPYFCTFFQLATIAENPRRTVAMFSWWCLT